VSITSAGMAMTARRLDANHVRAPVSELPDAGGARPRDSQVNDPDVTERKVHALHPHRRQPDWQQRPGPSNTSRRSLELPGLSSAKRADDGNRTRMTSLEVRSPGLAADLLEHRFWSSVLTCP
jgi:hypothetical protein